MAAMNKYPYEQRVKTYLEAIRTFGEEYQEEVAVEELSELIKEICKNWRGNDNRAAIANAAVCDYMDSKIERLHMRIQEHLYRDQ